MTGKVDFSSQPNELVPEIKNAILR